MKGPSSTPADLVELAERLRREGRRADAFQAVERCLGQNPNYPRAILLFARLLYQEGKVVQALDAIRPLRSLLGEDGTMRTIAAGLEQLWQERNSPADPSFVTETMAELLAQQGYLLEAMEIYRRLFLSSGGEKRLREKISLLRERLGREGSRDSRQEKLAQELEGWDHWLQGQQRED